MGSKPGLCQLRSTHSTEGPPLSACLSWKPQSAAQSGVSRGLEGPATWMGGGSTSPCIESPVYCICIKPQRSLKDYKLLKTKKMSFIRRRFIPCFTCMEWKGWRRLYWFVRRYFFFMMMFEDGAATNDLIINLIDQSDKIECQKMVKRWHL